VQWGLSGDLPILNGRVEFLLGLVLLQRVLGDCDERAGAVGHDSGLGAGLRDGAVADAATAGNDDRRLGVERHHLDPARAVHDEEGPVGTVLIGLDAVLDRDVLRAGRQQVRAAVGGQEGDHEGHRDEWAHRGDPAVRGEPA
jgi:hypothetical protein